MAAKRILLLGAPELWRKCTAVKDIALPETKMTIRGLRDTLADFRKKNGFGRGIAAPQIGVLKRIIYVHFPKAGISGALINPRIVKRSRTRIRLWDDCFSFPELLVKVQRAREVTVSCTNEKGENCVIAAKDDLAELLQHEIDHLDGILAVQRAIDNRSFAWRKEETR
jgi:peptide deformylase